MKTRREREPVLIGLRDFRNKVCAVIREANATGQRVVILRHGTPTAVLIPQRDRRLKNSV